jgi:hypothetical protein
MKKVLLATVFAAGVSLAAASGVSAAPASGTVLDNAAAVNDGVTQVQHWRWGSRRWGWGGGGHWRWGSRGGHWRWGSRGYRWGWRRW